MSRKISLSKVVLVALGIWLASSACFAVLYLQRQAPRGLEALADTPKRLLNQPPTFLGHLTVPSDQALFGPLAVASGEDDRVYAADSGNSTIMVFSSEGEYLMSFGEKGTGDGQLDYPTSLRVKNGRVYVADFRNGRVSVFSTEGRFLQNFSRAQGSEPLVPLALDVDDRGQVYIADRSHRVVVLDEAGKFLRSFGRGGSEEGQFAYPNGIMILGDRVYVADSGNGRVQVFSAAGEVAKILTGFVNPRGLAVDGRGQIYVVDPLAHTVTVFSREHTKLYTFGSRGLEGGQFNFPNGVAVDSRVRIYVADRENNRISVWR